MAVLTKQVAAGAFTDDDYAKLDEKTRSDITVLAQTERLTRHLVPIRKDMDPAVAQRLEVILLALAETTNITGSCGKPATRQSSTCRGRGGEDAAKAAGNLLFPRERIEICSLQDFCALRFSEAIAKSTDPRSSCNNSFIEGEVS
jgi:ABC transporter, phosphonate, periplasmic substrate-binding protein